MQKQQWSGMLNNVRWIRTVACGLGVTFGVLDATAALAQSSGQYVSPQRWSNFNPPSTVSHFVPAEREAASPSDLGGSLLSPEPLGDYTELLPLPYEMFSEDSASLLPSPPPGVGSTTWGSGLLESAPVAPNAMDAPYIFPWFGGTDLLFWSVDDRGERRLVVDATAPAATALQTGDADPQWRLGFDVFVGRYLDNGHHAISFNYLHFDPSSRSAGATAAVAGDLAIALPGWSNTGYYDDPADPNSDFYDLESIFGQMTDYRVTRDLRFQGIELNFWSFGLGGARPIGYDSSGRGSSRIGRLSGGYALPRGYRVGGLTGPMELPTTGNSQFALSHGFRWFEIHDDLALRGSGGLIGGVVADEQFYASQGRNDLFGYQLGGRWTHTITPRWNLGIGAKMGVYANSVEVTQRIGDANAAAVYLNDLDVAGRTAVAQRDRSTALAGLGEINLGTGVRLTDGLAFRGGYRLLGVSGIATTPELLGQELAPSQLSAKQQANDSLVLHGAYLGLEFNW